MHAIQFLKEAHGQAKAAFQKIEGAPAHERRALWAKLHPELELHEKIEETCLYASVAREVQADRELTQWATAHHQEVQEAESLIEEINRQDPADERWLATVKKLRGALEQHIRKEEGEIWPKIERVWDAPRLEDAGRQMESVKHAETSVGSTTR
jgi:hemerythrin-like domain-containing protein